MCRPMAKDHSLSGSVTVIVQVDFLAFMRVAIKVQQLNRRILKPSFHVGTVDLDQAFHVSNKPVRCFRAQAQELVSAANLFTFW